MPAFAVLDVSDGLSAQVPEASEAVWMEFSMALLGVGVCAPALPLIEAQIIDALEESVLLSRSEMTSVLSRLRCLCSPFVIDSNFRGSDAMPGSSGTSPP